MYADGILAEAAAWQTGTAHPRTSSLIRGQISLAMQGPDSNNQSSRSLIRMNLT